MKYVLSITSIILFYMSIVCTVSQTMDTPKVPENIKKGIVYALCFVSGITSALLLLTTAVLDLI